MKKAIRQRALELGFDACAFTSAAAPASGEHFRRWIDSGRHGEMGYLQRNAHKRIDPSQVLAGARSIVCLAASYHRPNTLNEPLESLSEKSILGGTGYQSVPSGDSPEGMGRASETTASAAFVLTATAVPFGESPTGAGESPALPIFQGGSETQPARTSSTQNNVASPTPHFALRIPHWPGVVARYARFSDYHEILAARLKDLATFVNQLGGEESRSLWYVDTGPLLERDLAQRAGLGFTGKHTNLISRELGNWFFLSEIITTLELEPDAPEKNHCGTCTRCMTACPTQAITAPFQLDARRCISYLTIELKGSIPKELRPAVGNRIYGCDDCLAVCPWNRFAREGRLMRDHVRADLDVPQLLELLALDDAAFTRRFRGTPLARTKRRGLLRNVCVALGNIGDARALPVLARAAQDSEALIAEHARWAVEQIQARVERTHGPA